MYKNRKLYNLNYGRTLKGLVKKIYFHQIRNCKERKHALPLYTADELELHIINTPEYYEVYNAWVLSNYNKELTPSVDRLDNTKSYTFENIEIVTWKVNKERAYYDTRNATLKNKGLLNGGHKPVCMFDIEGNKLNEFISVSEAARQLKLPHQFISRACATNHIFYKGYFWAFKDDVLSKQHLFTREVADEKIKASIRSSGYIIQVISDTEIKEFLSLAQASKFLCISPKTLKKYIENPSINTTGYTLTYKDKI